MNKKEINYWNNFYSNINTSTDCSDFCNFVLDWFKDNDEIKNVIDCGCGNGRDSYKLSQKYNVIAIDSSGYIPKNNDNVIFSNNDFVTIDKSGFDLVYSRFTFHSISNEQHEVFLNSVKKNSFLTIETRSKKCQNDELFHGKEHFRNYTDLKYLKDLLIKYNFEIIYIKEDKDFAIYKNENPFCIRVICKKK